MAKLEGEAVGEGRGEREGGGVVIAQHVLLVGPHRARRAHEPVQRLVRCRIVPAHGAPQIGARVVAAYATPRPAHQLMHLLPVRSDHSVIRFFDDVAPFGGAGCCPIAVATRGMRDVPRAVPTDCISAASALGISALADC